MPDLRYVIDRETERLLSAIQDWSISHGEPWRAVRDELLKLHEYDIAEWWENYCLDDGEENEDEGER